MKKKIFATLLLATAMTSGSYAGLHGLTHHSRANCGNNESISWHAGHNYWLWVTSRHANDREDHTVSTGWQNTWRAAAVHWGEGTRGWAVEGTHWTKDNAGKAVQLANEAVNNCSIYDGWWD